MKHVPGYTLVELVVAVAVVGMVATVVMVLLGQGMKAYRSGADRVETQQAARGELEPVMRTVRNAAYVLHAGPHSFEVMDPGGMRVLFSNPEARMTYAGLGEETQDVLHAHPGLIRSITVELGPFMSTATLRNEGSTDPAPNSWCAYGAYTPGGWNIMCGR